MNIYEMVEERLQTGELPCFGSAWGGIEHYSTLKEAREAKTEDVSLLAIEIENEEDNWKLILLLPRDLVMSRADYEDANFPQGSYVEADEEWERFREIFDGKDKLPLEFVLEKALQHPEAYNMLMEAVSRLGESGYFDEE